MVPVWIQGWLWPRLPKSILKVLHPIALAKSWCPKQIPNIGLDEFSNTFFRFWTVSRHIWGSPGPLLKKRPSWFLMALLRSWFHGTTSIRAPLPFDVNKIELLIILSFVHQKILKSYLGFYFCGVEKKWWPHILKVS